MPPFKALHWRYDPQSSLNPSISHSSLAKAGCSKLKEEPKSNHLPQTLYNVPHLCLRFGLYGRNTAGIQQPGSFVVRYNTKSLLLLAYNGASTERVSSSSLLQNVSGNALINSWQRSILTDPCSWTIICSNFTKARGCYNKTLLALPMAQFNNVMTSRIKNRLQRKVCCIPIILRKFNIHEGYCLKQSTS